LAGYSFSLPITGSYFWLTLNAVFALVVLLALWALWRSTPLGRNISDVGSGVRIFGLLSFAILVLAFIELQPLLLSGMFKMDEVRESISAWLQAVAVFFVSIGTVVGFLGRFLGDALKRSAEKPGRARFVARIAIKLAMYIASAAVPLALWLAYLY